MTRTAPALTRNPRGDKVARRREELADAALRTLGELGYARTSLREIAQNSNYSHGVVHYYFSDKHELISYCVRRYKETCATRYDELVLAARTAEELRTGFAAQLRHTLLEDTAMHRLWYDMRAQSMFEPQLREDTTAIDQRLQAMIAAVVSRYAELLEVSTPVDPHVAYVVLDGLFENCLVRMHGGDVDAPERLQVEAARLLDMLVGPTPRID